MLLMYKIYLIMSISLCINLYINVYTFINISMPKNTAYPRQSKEQCIYSHLLQKQCPKCRQIDHTLSVWVCIFNQYGKWWCPWDGGPLAV